MICLRCKLCSCRNLIILLLFLFAVQAGAEAATCTWDGAWDQTPGAGDHIVIESGDLVWDASLPDTVGSWMQAGTYDDTVTFETVYPDAGLGDFTSFSITGDATINGGTWTHPANAGTEQYRLRVTVGGDLMVGTGGAINVDGRGFASRQGPGGSSNSRDGGSHGGRGGDRLGTVGPTYGSVTNPVNLGSGGGSTAGGGAVIISVSDTITINGTVSSRGAAGRGAGSGGSINITAGALAGAGTIRANGFSSTDGGYASGGGGRVAVFLTAGTDFGSVVFQAFGGGAGTNGAAGTVYLEKLGDDPGKGELIVDNSGRVTAFGETVTELSEGGDALHNFSQVTISGQGNLSVREADVLDFSLLNLSPDGASSAFLTLSHADAVTFPATFVLPADCTLNLDVPISATGNWTVPENAALSHNRNRNAETYKLELDLTGNLTVDTGGEINVDGMGYARLQGTGAGSSGSDGGSYGGRGGLNAGITYGCVINPVNLGSGGGSTAGGGAVIISVSDTITINGTVSSRGAAGRGAGSGGSINITAGALAGAGTIRANGFCSTDSGWSSGGGGRISLAGLSEDNFTGTLEANGGTLGIRGYAGTVYLNEAKRNNLTLGGPGNLATLRLGTDDTPYEYIFGTVTIRDGGTLEIDGNPYLYEVNGVAYGTSTTVNINTLDVRAGGTLSADALGYHRRQGPGGCSDSRDGGSHGGRGGDINGTVGPTYGSVVNSVIWGSGGGETAGGGAIIINVSDVLIVDGTVSSNSGSGRATGSGGSINITAGALAGSGTIRANASNTTQTSRASGGGGRVAVFLTDGTDFGSVVFQAFGGRRDHEYDGAAGTVYRETAADAPGAGELIISNPHAANVAAGTLTELPASHATLSYPDELKLATLIIEENGVVGLTADITVGDLIFAD